GGGGAGKHRPTAGETAEDLIASTDSASEDLRRFRAILDTIENQWLKRLVTMFLEDEPLMQRFATAAAAKKWHHASRGGLVRHCYEMARIAQTMCELFPEMDRDMLLSAVFFHDLGKLNEMSQDLFVDYTTEGKLIGHVQIGVDMVQDRIREIEGFPSNLRMELIHCVLSHHGEYVNGAPVLPKTLEAIALYHIDNLDAQTSAVARVIEETRGKRQTWSDFLPLINRVIYAKER
ncbi:MAG TPA: HD domain-containing protein, partial [Candidatus Hydrogenedentes bacterium]|nr:HD domain-containing protein [Candidatus Hydrogenedentota bacterium]